MIEECIDDSEITTYQYGEMIDEILTSTKGNDTYIYHVNSIGSTTNLSDIVVGCFSIKAPSSSN